MVSDFLLGCRSGSIQRFWRRPSDIASGIVFCALLLTMVVVRASLGMWGMRYYSHDAFLVLDGAWRMLNGQRPHLDFNSMVGPVAYLPTVIGFRLAANTAAGFGYGQALMGFVTGVWSYILGHKLSAAPRVLYALCVAAIALSPHQLGLSPFAITPGMTYNRYSYALLGVLLIECLVSEDRFDFLAGFSSGVVLAILGFTKITSIGCGVLLLIGLIPVRQQSRQRWFGIVAGGLLAALPFLIYIHFDLVGVVRDLAITVHAKREHFIDVYLINSIARDAGIVLLLSLVGIFFLNRVGETRTAIRLLAASVTLVIVSLLLIFTSYQQSDLPLLTLFVIVLSHVVLATPQTNRNTEDGLSLMIAGGALVFAGVTLGSCFVSLVGEMWLKTHSARAATRFEAPALQQFVPLEPDSDYTFFLNDGFRLLEQHRRPGERVMALDFTNPFSYGFWIPPAPGGSTNLQYDGSFNDRWKVSPERLFGAADIVMMPKSFSDITLATKVPQIYGPYLESHFQFVAESWGWKLYRLSVPMSREF